MLRRRGERGSAMVIGVLVTFVMAGVAMVVVANTVLEIGNAGTARITRQVYYLAEAGLTGPIARAAENQDRFLGFVQGNGYTISMDDVSADFFDLSPWGSFGPEFSSKESATFRTYFSDPVDTQRIPGYSASGYCYRRYTVTSVAQLGQERDAFSSPEAVLHAAQARFISHVYFGPFPCGM